MKLSHSFRLVLPMTLLLLGACAKSERPTALPVIEQPLMQPIALEEWNFQLGEYPPDILVVDYWASWCGPCLERFPQMIEMAERYADAGVSFVSFNLDDPGDPIAQIQAEDFLQVMEAPFAHYRIDTSVFTAMEYLGLTSLPAVSFYDRTGIEAQRLEGIDENGEVFDESDVEAVIQQLLAAE